MDKIIPLEAHEKRLKPLDEFEPPPWSGLRVNDRRPINLALLIAIGLTWNPDRSCLNHPGLIAPERSAPDIVRGGCALPSSLLPS